MKKMNKKGLQPCKGIFITFEGPEGSGKSIQAKLFFEYLKNKRFSVVHTIEPGGTEVGKLIRKVLVDPKNNVFPTTELFLNLADRAQHVQEIIKPALEKGKIVICERFNDATLAYQGYGRGLDFIFIAQTTEYVSGGLIPDLTFLLDIEVKEGLTRAINTSKDFKKGKADRFEREDVVFHEKVRSGYLKIAKKENKRIKIIASTGSIKEISKKIIGYAALIIK